MTDKVGEKIQEVVNKITQEYKPEKIILFGSWAWGTPDRKSDIDLFIVKKSREPRIERERQVQRLLLGSQLPIDIIIYTPEEVKNRQNINDFFINRIFTKGKVLYPAL